MLHDARHNHFRVEIVDAAAAGADRPGKGFAFRHTLLSGGSACWAEVYCRLPGFEEPPSLGAEAEAWDLTGTCLGVNVAMDHLD